MPVFLRGEEKVLEEYGRRMRAKHGRGTKHHLKFDEGETTIFLNIRKLGDREWSRVYADDAREWVRKMRKEDADNIDRNFNRSSASSNGNGFPPPITGINLPSSSYTAAAVNGRSGKSSESGSNEGKRMTGWTGSAGSATMDRV